MATTKKIKDGVSDVDIEVTADTLSDMASQASLGRIDEKTALIVKLCESKRDKICLEKTAILNGKIIALQERYIGLLRELRDKLRSIRFDDFLKIIVGILGGFLARAFSQQGIEALKDSVVAWSILLFIVCFIFLVFRYFGPSNRKKEIMAELQRLNGEKKND